MPEEKAKKEAAPVAAAEDSLDWETESSSELYKFETVGQKLTGLLVHKKTGKTQMGDANFYTILTAKGEETFIPTKSLGEDLEKFLRTYGGVGKVIVEVELVDLKKSTFPNPFKVFKARAAAATEARLSALGLMTYDTETTSSEEEEAPL